MNKKNYTAPSIAVVEMAVTEIIAASLTDSYGTPKANFQITGEVERGDAGEEALSAGRQYFDDWSNDEE